MGYPNFDIKCSSSSEVSYVKSEDILNFLKSYANHYDVAKYIKFYSYVVRVHPVESKWQVGY